MRMIVRFAVVGLLLGAGIAATAADKDYSKDFDVYTDVVYGHKHALAMTMDVLQPKKGNGAAVVWIVSGAWHSGLFPPQAAFSSSYPYAGFFDCRALLDKRFAMFFVRHGDGEKFTMPEIVDDCRRSIRFIRLNARKYGVDPERLGALGGSAGGHLAMMLATTSDEGVPNPKNWDGVLRTSDRIAAAVAYFPPTDIRAWWENGNVKYYQEAFKFDPQRGAEFSPLLWASPKSAPALMIHGDKDYGVPIWHSEKMVAAYKQHNAPGELLVIEGVGHGFDIGFKGFAQYTPQQMQIMIRARDASVAWFEKFLLGPRKEAKVVELAAPAAAPKVNLSQKYAVVDLAAGAAGPWPMTELDAAPDDLLANDAWRTTKVLLRRIPAGKFRMGTPASDTVGQLYVREYHAEDPQHTVTLTKPFYVGVFPLTQEQWSRVMGSNPSYFAGNRKRPVENVSWLEVRGDDRPDGKPGDKSFIGRFRQGTSQAFDLPTEAQWEYACRAGTTRALNDPAANKGEGTDCTDATVAKIAWFEANSQRQTHDVGLKAPNAWGLYDTCGNVSQWCLDLFGDYPGDVTDPVGPTPEKRRSGHILRGGYWSMPAPGCRSSARNYDCANPPYTGRLNVCGLRLALPAEQ
jgi:formylglycine-generating enzyme required for sulfatase activity/acetyl esterase/lipase